MKAIFAALLICLGCNVFAERAAPLPATCVPATASATVASELAIIKTGGMRADATALLGAPAAAAGEIMALRAAAPSMARRTGLPDVPARAQAQPSGPQAGEPPIHGWSDSGLLLVSVALMAGIALRRWLVGSR